MYICVLYKYIYYIDIIHIYYIYLYYTRFSLISGGLCKRHFVLSQFFSLHFPQGWSVPIASRFVLTAPNVWTANSALPAGQVMVVHD